MKYFLSLIFMLLSFVAGTQNLLTPHSQGMGGQSVHMQEEAALLGNPAGLAELERWAAIAAFERRFQLAELDLLGAGMALPFSSGSFGLTVQSFGFDEFRQQSVALSYGRKLTQNLRIGGEVDYSQTRIDEYGNEGILGFTLGLQADVDDELTLGTQLVNPMSIERSTGEELPTIFQFGAAYRPSENVTTGFEVEKDVNFPLRVKAGLSFQVTGVLQISAGFSSNPGQFHFGIGIVANERVNIDTSVRYHQVLGMTPTIGVAYSGKNG